MDLYFPFLAYVLKAFTKSFGIWDHCENVVSACVPVRIDVIVSLLLVQLVVHFYLESMENPVMVIASAECHMDVLVVLVQ